jgi:hypothetical protein
MERQASHAMFIAGRCRPAMRIALDAGDCAAHEIFISPAARSDLLFTMSDNPHAGASTRHAKPCLLPDEPIDGERR